MYKIRPENTKRLHSHNIRVSALNSSSPAMSNQPPRRVINLPKVRMLSRPGRPSSGIRITNVKTIKPPDPELVKKQEEEKLRAQLQKEIVSRSRQCAYKKYECLLPVLTGRQYCGRHILHDPSAPYRRCGHDRCTMPAKDTDEHGLCFEHARAAMCARARSIAPPPPAQSAETLLHNLTHYVRVERARTTSCASSVSVISEPADQDAPPPPPVDPFKQIDAPAINQAHSTAIMECGSCSDSDADSVTAATPPVHPDTDTGLDTGSTERNPLWHAGIFTAEEAVSEAKTTLKSLQSSYIRQMGRLRVLLQMARHQYLKSLKAEKEQYCSIHSQSLSAPPTVKERRQLRRLKALAGYRRPHAVLQRKLHRKRDKINHPPNTKPLPSSARCIFSEGGVRCLSAALPAARHCRRHILHDGHQVLYRACADPRGGVPCREPLPAAAPCRYHTDPPPYTVFTLKKDDSDSDSDSATSTISRASALVPLDSGLT